MSSLNSVRIRQSVYRYLPTYERRSGRPEFNPAWTLERDSLNSQQDNSEQCAVSVGISLELPSQTSVPITARKLEKKLRRILECEPVIPAHLVSVTNREFASDHLKLFRMVIRIRSPERNSNDPLLEYSDSSFNRLQSATATGSWDARTWSYNKPSFTKDIWHQNESISIIPQLKYPLHALHDSNTISEFMARGFPRQWTEEALFREHDAPGPCNGSSAEPWNEPLWLKNARSLCHHLMREIWDRKHLWGSYETIRDILFDRLEPGNRVLAFSISIMPTQVLSIWTRLYSSRKPDRQKIDEHSSRSAHRAFVAFGSNIGDRVGMVEKALERMEKEGIKILKASSLWETAAMYVTDQASFINGVCEIETQLSQQSLLSTLQKIEKDMGREKLIEKGPRNIDLDILLYDDLTHQSVDLTIPHPFLTERDFVLNPLCEIIPSERLPPPHPAKSFQEYLQQLPPRDGPSAVKSFPLSSSAPLIVPSKVDRTTQLMAILNVTPDSFSDGGIHSPQDLDSIISAVQKFVAFGATIIDVGGQSTRPGAAPLSEDDEISRVVPVIERIRSMPETTNVAISIDTFSAKVAEEAVKAGADIINDVSGGTMDDQMLPTVARLRKTIILMHMRGTPETMSRLSDYPNGIIRGVGDELAARINAALEAGIPRWRIILDPGIGFAKNQKQNLQLLREFEKLREYGELEGYPWVVGSSRKGFIGRITGVETPSERGWGTAVTVAEAVRGGADIVRVHDVAEMAKVVKMADALWRTEDIQRQAMPQTNPSSMSSLEDNSESGQDC